ncbi:MAG: helix-turn-helix transcriptional regulator [Actinobacteria bacterium]|nr:helix-turn-helix transcriptional regulator [Actinomycetota bacterium]
MDGCDHVEIVWDHRLRYLLPVPSKTRYAWVVRDALKGHVDLLLLSALEDEPAHGYELVQTLRERSEGAFDLAEGTVYPSLYRLERRGLIASRWETVAGRRRRVYGLTKSGRRGLEEGRSEWNLFVRAVEAVVR